MAATDGLDPMKLAKLGEYNVVIACDNSGSMLGWGWKVAEQALYDLAEIAGNYDDDGIDLCFMNHVSKEAAPEGKFEGGYYNLKAGDMAATFKKVQPRSVTPLGGMLKRIIDPYQNLLAKSPGQKPLLILALTDGAPTDDPLAENTIIAIGDWLEDNKFPTNQLGIQMVQIGNDAGAAAYLDRLDKGLKTKRDITDTIPWSEIEANPGKGMVKALLGAIDKLADDATV